MSIVSGTQLAQTPSGSPAVATTHATQEQAFIVEQAHKALSFKVIAYAGTGKTTTLQMISHALTHKRGMYLAFNKAIAAEAKTKFARHVDCRTFHSLAYTQTDRRITDKLNLPRLSPSRMAEHYQLRPITVRRNIDKRYESFMFSPSRQANIISNALSNFCRTHARFPAARHIDLPDWLHPSDDDQLRSLLTPLVEQRWLDAVTPADPNGIGHDVYLKLWALSAPAIPSDFILFDEAQDSDPLMLGILLKQAQTQVMYVGDPHQQIYGWRGAVNAMQQLPLPAHRLTQSFRFGAPIAEVANILLAKLGETTPLQGNPHGSSSLDNKPMFAGKKAVLCRTNARAMELLLLGVKKGHQVSLQADVERIGRFVQAAERLKAGKTVQDVPELAWFNSWDDVHEYCETAEGSDLKTLVRLVDDYGTARLEKVIIQARGVKQPDYVISTAHKAKGLEWSHVQIQDDFNYKILKNETWINPEELRLLYVACTRAKTVLNTYHLSELITHLRKYPVTQSKNP